MSDSIPPRGLWRRQILWPEVDRGLAFCVLALVALLSFLFTRVILRGEVFFERDVLVVWVPQVEAFVRAIHAGSWPVWDPWAAFGSPMLGNANTQVFYPFTWLNLMIRPLTLYALYVLAHLLFTGVGFHLWARRVGVTPSAATFGACVWVASGPLLSLANVWNHFAGAAWLPWLLWASDRALGEGGWRHGLRLAFVIALQIYAGSPDLCIFSGLVLVADALRRAASERPRWRPLLRLVGPYILAVGLGAGQIAPSLDLALRSGSRPLPEAERTSWSLHPAALAQILAPVSFKDVPALAPQLTQPLSDLWAPFMKSNYLGLASALFVVWAILAAERRAVLFFALILVISVAAALGRYSIAYGGLTTVVPLLKMVRFPSRMIIVGALAWAMMAGLGYDAWRNRVGGLPTRARLFATASLLALAVALAAAAAGFTFFPGTLRLSEGGPTWGTILSLARLNVTLSATLTALVAILCARRGTTAVWTARLVPLLVVADLAFSNRQINPTAVAALLDQPPEILASIPRDPSARVYVWDYVLRVPGRGHPTSGILGLFVEVSALPDPSLGALAFQSYLYPPSAARWGLRGSFDRDLIGLNPPWLNEMNLLLRSVEDTPAYTQLLQLGGVSRVVALHRDIEALPRVTEIEGIFRRPIQVFEVPDPWPRTYVVCRTRTVAPGRSLLTLLAPDFDPNQEVVADREVTLRAPCHEGVSRILEDRPDRVTLEATLDGSGVVTLLDGFADGWKVTIDDVPGQILRVNHVFRGVMVEPGQHRVTFVYRPASLSLGIAISALTALFILAASLTHRSRIPAPDPHGPRY